MEEGNMCFFDEFMCSEERNMQAKERMNVPGS